MTRATITPGDGDPRHGTYNGYRNLNCRCDLCKAAWAAWNTAARARRAKRLAPDDPRHGLPHIYQNHNCRCPKCTKAKTEYDRKRESKTPKARRKKPDEAS